MAIGPTTTPRQDHRGRVGADQALRVAPLRRRIATCALLGVAVGTPIGVLGPWRVACLVGWDVAASCFALWVWIEVWTLDPDAVAVLARREDPGRTVVDSSLLLASIACLVGVGLVLLQAAHAKGAEIAGLLALGVVSVVISWGIVHTLFTLTYARIYYRTQKGGGIDFHGGGPPAYPDFAYIAFTVGMTFQVSDSELQTKEMRAAVLRHALVSYLFGAVIIALTVNVAAGLLK